MANEDEVVVTATLRDALSRPADKAADAVEDLGDEAVKAATKVKALGSSSASAARDVDELEASARRAKRAMQAHEEEMSRSSKSTDDLDKSSNRFTSTLKKMGGLKFNLGKVLGLYKIPALVTGLGFLVAAVSALGAAAFGAAAGLAPLVGLLTALPAAGLAGAQAMGAIKFATSGFSEALKQLSDPEASPEALAAALDKLQPSAQSFARQLVALNKGPLKEMREATQNALFPGLSRGLKSITPLLDVIAPAMETTAKTIGDLAAQAGAAMGTPFFSSQLARIMATNVTVIGSMGRAGGYLGQTLLDLVDAFRPVMVEIGRYAEAGAKFVATSTRAGLESGKLGAFFQRAWELGKGVGRVLSNVAKALYNTGRAAAPMADWLGGSLERLTEKWANWTASTEGQSSLRAYFQDAIPIVSAFGGLLGDLGKMFAGAATNDALVPLISQIRTQLLPAFQEFSQGLGTDLGPALVSGATALVNFGTIITGSPMGSIIRAIADALAALTNAATNLPGPLQGAIGVTAGLAVGLGGMQKAVGMVSAPFSGLTEVVQGFRGTAEAGADGFTMLQKAGSGTKSAIDNFRAGLDNSAAAQSAFTGRMGTMGGGFAKFKGAVMATRLGPVFTAIATGARAMWTALLGPIGIVILAIVAVVAIAVLLYNKWAPFRNLVDTIAAAVVGFAQQAMSFLRPLGAFFVAMFKVWLSVAGVVFRGIGIYVRVLWFVIRAVFAVIGTIVVVAFKVWWAIAKATFKGIGAAVRVVGAVIRAIFAPLVGWVRARFASISEGGGKAMERIRTAFRTGVDKIRGFFRPLGEFLRNIWSGMTEGASKALGGLRGQINNVIGAVNRAINSFNKLPGPDVPTIPMLFTGGPVRAGMQAMVGEMGPEPFISHSGKQTIVGKHGPEIMRFPTAGTVLPNHLLEASKQTDAQISPAMIRALKAHGNGAPDRDIPQPRRESDAPPAQITMKFEVYPQSEFDMAEAAAAAVRKVREEEESRKIHWRDEP